MLSNGEMSCSWAFSNCKKSFFKTRNLGTVFILKPRYLQVPRSRRFGNVSYSAPGLWAVHSSCNAIGRTAYATRELRALNSSASNSRYLHLLRKGHDVVSEPKGDVLLVQPLPICRDCHSWSKGWIFSLQRHSGVIEGHTCFYVKGEVIPKQDILIYKF